MSSTDKKPALSPDEAREIVRDIVAKTPKHMCVLTTVEVGSNRLRSRPMAILNKAEDDVVDVLYFITGIDTGKVEEVAEETQVNVAFHDDMRFATFSGTSMVTRDRATIDRLWTPALAAYFDNGKDDPTVAVLKVTPTAVEYWDSPGLVGHVLEVAKSMLPGQKYNAGNSGHLEV